jgi:hypothetical protein
VKDYSAWWHLIKLEDFFVYLIVVDRYATAWLSGLIIMTIA